MSSGATANVTCTKRYSDIPFAHRQHMHDGHCAWIHGHNWAIELTFGATEMDACGFVVDFGKLKFIGAWIDEHLDHALLLNASDPQLDHLRASLALEGEDGRCTLCGDLFEACAHEPLAHILVIDDASSEGLARFFFDTFDEMVREATGGRSYVVKCQVIEDSLNSATYTK